MADEPLEFTGITTLSTPVPRILDKAAKANLTRIVIVGATEDGEEFFLSSEPDGGVVLWDLARAQHKILSIVDD